jgi:hypothetical protein
MPKELQVTVLVFLQGYLIHAALALNLIYLLPLILFYITRQPWPLPAAELVSVAIYMLICLVIILTVASSIIKLLLVMSFNWIFVQDPEQLALRVLVVSAILAIVPNLIFTLIIILVHHECSSAAACILMGFGDESCQLNLNRVYFLTLLAVSVCLAVTVVFGIPIYLKRVHTATSIRYGRNVMCSETFYH